MKYDVVVRMDGVKRACQVLACDPEDTMISEGSSTKAGVSVMIELGSRPSSLDVYEPPKVRCVASTHSTDKHERSFDLLRCLSSQAVAVPSSVFFFHFPLSIRSVWNAFRCFPPRAMQSEIDYSIRSIGETELGCLCRLVVRLV